MYRARLCIVTCAACAAVSVLPARAADTNSWGWITFWSGAKLQNPYNIVESGGAATLANSHATTDGYIELNLNTRYVVRSGKFDDLPAAWGAPPSPPPPPGSIHFVPFWREMPDIDAKIGYIFRGSSAPTNLSVATIVGSADLYSDVSVGWPLLRYESDDDPTKIVKQQVTLELSGGFATDKNFLVVHPNLFIGGGWQGRFPAPNLTPQPLPAVLCGRVGLARIDEPHLLAGDTVALDSLGEPIFDQIWTPSMGFQMVYPINSAVNLQAGGNVYFTAAPASWNLNLGLTLDLGKFFSAFTK
jgi:hypothetical protein